MTRFNEALLQRLAGIEEVDIETREGPDAPAHRVTIWIVVDGDAAYVRSVHGTRGRWYREATTYPHAVLYANAQALPVHVESVQDADTITRVSESFLRKYAPWPGDARAMVRDEVLATTLRLEMATAS